MFVGLGWTQLHRRSTDCGKLEELRLLECVAEPSSSRALTGGCRLRRPKDAYEIRCPHTEDSSLVARTLPYSTEEEFWRCSEENFPDPSEKRTLIAL